MLSGKSNHVTLQLSVFCAFISFIVKCHLHTNKLFWPVKSEECACALCHNVLCATLLGHVAFSTFNLSL